MGGWMQVTKRVLPNEYLRYHSYSTHHKYLSATLYDGMSINFYLHADCTDPGEVVYRNIIRTVYPNGTRTAYPKQRSNVEWFEGLVSSRLRLVGGWKRTSGGSETFNFAEVIDAWDDVLTEVWSWLTGNPEVLNKRCYTLNLKYIRGQYRRLAHHLMLVRSHARSAEALADILYTSTFMREALALDWPQDRVQSVHMENELNKLLEDDADWQHVMGQLCGIRRVCFAWEVGLGAKPQIP